MIARTSLFIAAALTVGLAHAGGTNYHYAEVVDVRAEYKEVRKPIDREVCWDETTYERTRSGSRSHTPTVVGAIIGGVIGNQFGGGSGQRAATVAGAALGGSIGRDAARKSGHPDEYRKVIREKCQVQRSYTRESVASGYRVTYQYDCRLYRTHMNEHPGDRIRVRVDVSPMP